MKGEVKEIRLYIKSWTEDWSEAEERVFHGRQITKAENPELYEFVEKLLKKTYYDTCVISRIYKTIEKGFVIVLFDMLENKYGGYIGTTTTYVTIDDIIKNIKR
jgi:hypothetical protein